MNRTNIDWTDYSLNPVVGCTHGCPYCYAVGQAKRQKERCQLCYDFVPHAHLERLDQLTPRQKPKKVFIDSMWDWCCKDNKREWLDAIIAKMRECRQHTFQVLSKRPACYANFDFPENVWLGATITRECDLYRLRDLEQAWVKAGMKNLIWVSVEPILGRFPWYNRFMFKNLHWIVIGAMTGRNPVKPKREWVDSVIRIADTYNIPVFLKDNLGELKREFGNREEFPDV